MRRHTVNMFASTNEDLPLFSGATVAVEVAEFNPPVVEEEVKPMAMFDNRNVPVVLQVSPKDLYRWAVAELKADGYTVQDSGRCDEQMVLVWGLSMSKGYCEHCATNYDGVWEMKRIYKGQPG